MWGHGRIGKSDQGLEKDEGRELVGDDQETLESTFYLQGEGGELVDFLSN